MDFKIIVNTEDKNLAIKQTKSLKSWIEDEELEEVEIELKRKELQADEAGAGVVESILAVVLGAKAVVELVKTINTWIQEKTKREVAATPKLSLTIETIEGEKITIDAENIGKTEQAIIEKLSKIVAQNEEIK
jgi:hypothetical protein